MPSISGLHLTDLHLREKIESAAWPSIRTKFLLDLAKLHERTGPWDLVLFTGDLVQSGKTEEFDHLKQWLYQLWEEFRKLGSEPSLLAIPGNHDLLRPDSKSPEVKALNTWPTDPEIRDTFWSDDNAYLLTVKSAFNHFSAWQKSPGVPSLTLREGRIPGDFSAVLEKKGIRLGILGLNSSFLQLTSGNYEGRLEVDSRQVDPLCDGDISAWAEKHTVNIVMTHHPPSWLSPSSQSSFRDYIAPAGRFALHLYGHMHEPHSEQTRVGGSAAQIFWQGESLFSEEPILNGKRRRHGYGAWRIDVTGKDREGKFSYWPRTAVDAHSGGKHIAPDHAFGLSPRDACEYEITLMHPLSLHHSHGGEEKIGPKRIGIITTGSDAPGLNACVRAIVRVAAAYGVDVVGFQDGFRGLEQALEIDVLRGAVEDQSEGNQHPDLVLLEDDKRPFFFFNSKFSSDQPALRNRRLMRQVSMIIHRGGSILLSKRYDNMRQDSARDRILDRICGAIEKHGLSHLVIIGGRGSMTAACLIAEFMVKKWGRAKCRVVGVPASIENDLYGLSDVAIGHDTALNTAVSCIDRIRDTGDAMLYEHLVQVSGGDSSLLAVEAGIAAGAEIVVADEREFLTQWKEADKLDQHMYGAGEGTKRKSRIVIACESVNMDRVLKGIDRHNRNFVTRLGHVQRGGTPSARDRLIATILGDWIARAVVSDSLFYSEAQQLEVDLFEELAVEVPVLASLSGDRVGWAKLTLRQTDSSNERELDTSRQNRIEASFGCHPSSDDERSGELRKMVQRVSRRYYYKDKPSE